MELKLKNWEIEIAAGIYRKFGPVRDVQTKWYISDNLGVLSGIVDRLAEIKKTPQELIDYNKKNEEIAGKFGTKIGSLVSPNGEVIPKYEFHDSKGYAGALKKLNEEYKSSIEYEPKRRDDIKNILDKEVTVNLVPLAYDTISDLIDANELAFMRKFGLVVSSLNSQSEDKVATMN
jgi:hypothetical protein